MGNVKRAGGWLPASRKKQAEWINRLLSDANAKNSVADSMEGIGLKHKSVKQLKALLDSDPGLYMLAVQMVEEGYEYDPMDPTGAPQVQDVDTLLILIDQILDTAPEYVQPDEEGRGLIGFPINAVLDWCMGTYAGQVFFLNEKVNAAFKEILGEWCDFLSKEGSRYVLNDSSTGWFCEAAKQEINIEEYEFDPNAEYYGFKSWNDFFYRKFKKGMRPIAEPDNPAVFVNACESAPYRISSNVKEDTKFWIKGQPYSLRYMLAQDKYTDCFIGGTVYQAFLSATHYHRWNSPVDGKIVEVRNIDGSYYAEVNSYPFDDAGPNNSQAYITHVAARAIIMIQTEQFGMVGMMPVGMSEVSSCVVTIKEGQTVKKGDELGYFQFGGSTHCLFFEPGVIHQFVASAIPADDFNDSTVMKINSMLAIAQPKQKK